MIFPNKCYKLCRKIPKRYSAIIYIIPEWVTA